LIEDQTPKKEKGMTIYKKDLQALNKDIKALGRTIDKLIKEFDKGKKAKVTKKTKAKPIKAKSIKKAPAEKASGKKRAAKQTATDKVLKIIKGSKRGVGAATLVKKTGYDLKKVRNIIQRTYKMGKIKRVGKGIYVGS
jgi:hypothetical protein